MQKKPETRNLAHHIEGLKRFYRITWYNLGIADSEPSCLLKFEQEDMEFEYRGGCWYYTKQGKAVATITTKGIIMGNHTAIFLPYDGNQVATTQPSRTAK